MSESLQQKVDRMTAGRTTLQYETFWTRVDRSGGPDACWPWLGTINYAGYGILTILKRQHRAHRVAFHLSGGSLVAGRVADHVCHNQAAAAGKCAGGPSCAHRRCCNPAHLEFVEQRDNVMRGLAPTAVNAMKTHCIHGHEFTPENTRYVTSGSRACLECRRAASRRHEARRRLATAVKRAFRAEALAALRKREVTR